MVSVSGSRVREDLVDRDAVDLPQALDEEGPDGGLVGVPLLLVQGGDHLGCPGQGGCAQDVGRAALVAGRAGGPADAVEPGFADGAAAGEVRSAGVEPVGAAHQDAGAERRVELVAREGEVVDVVRGDVDAAVRRELCGVHDDPGAEFVGQRGEARGSEGFRR